MYYLRFYKGYSKVDGKIKHNVDFENLELWKHKKPKTQAEKLHNTEAQEIADEILIIRNV